MPNTPETAHPAPPNGITQGVLVVDDDDEQREFFLRILPRVGDYNVFCASSGADALALLSNHETKINLVVCDLQMPGMDGMALLRRIGTFRRDVAVIVLSSADTSILRSVELMAKAMGLNVLGSLQKPVERSRLEKLVRLHREVAASVPRVAGRELGTADIDRALAGNEFIVYFQPKVSFISGKVSSAEALVRWQHPIHGLLEPEEFLPLVASSGRLVRLTQSILASSIAHVAEWRNRGCQISFSVNLSLSALSNPLFCEDIQALLASRGLKPEDLTFEILESATMVDVGRALETMTRLRLNGFGLAIDDFGTGFSSFEQLSRIPFSELKIDRAFVQGASHTPRLATMVRSCIELAERLNLKVVAEGVETEEDWNYLAKAGANEAQGYFISKPMPGEEIVSWIERWAAPHAGGDIKTG